MKFSHTALFAAVATALPQQQHWTRSNNNAPPQQRRVEKRDELEHQHQHQISQFRIRTDRPIQRRQNQLIPVVVGGTQDTFVPNMVIAAVGDVIQFQFSNGNHTVTQSAENSACQPLQATVATAVHSGHIPFQNGQTVVGTFNMPVTSTDPMFLYCATGPHCIEGQVMVVNPVSAQQVVQYAKISGLAAANVDGMNVVGGTVGSIPLAAAAFVPAAAEQGGGPGGAPGGGAPATEQPATSSTTSVPAATSAVAGTTTAQQGGATSAAAGATTAEGAAASTTIEGKTAVTLPLLG